MTDDGLGELFWRVARELRHRTREALQPWEVTPSQSRALAVLASDQPQRPGDLAERLRIAPRSATEVVDQLARLGLVARSPDAADRRATLITLTDQGRAAAQDIRDARVAEADRYFGRLGAADRTELARLLGKLADQGDQQPNNG